LHSHYGITGSTELSCNRLVDLLKDAVIREINDKKYELWKSMLPMMMLKLVPFIPFEEFTLSPGQKQYSDISNEAIEAEMSGVIEQSRRVR
jgi:hypothetical protein